MNINPIRNKHSKVLVGVSIELTQEEYFIVKNALLKVVSEPLLGKSDVIAYCLIGEVYKRHFCQDTFFGGVKAIRITIAQSLSICVASEVYDDMFVYFISQKIADIIAQFSTIINVISINENV